MTALASLTPTNFVSITALGVEEAEYFGAVGFPYRIIVDDPDAGRMEWCEEEFGPVAWITACLRAADGESRIFFNKSARWSWSRVGGRDNFHFRDDTDAILFKLRWVG